MACRSRTRQCLPVSVDHYENFPVASVLCPPAFRQAVVAIYWFARTADDIADEGTASTEVRLRQLAAYRQDLQALFTRQPPTGSWPHVFGALGRARQAHDLPLPPLLALLDAFVHDAGNPRHADRASLLWYCERSANPVGRLLMHLYGQQDSLSLKQSDAICTALQLINFWQDLGVDLRRGRLYLPTQELSEHGLDADALLRSPETPPAAELTCLVADLCRWARTLMLEGAPLALRLRGRAGWELRLVVQGGLRILDKIASSGHRTWVTRPRLRAWDVPLLAWRAWRMGQQAVLASAAKPGARRA